MLSQTEYTFASNTLVWTVSDSYRSPETMSSACSFNPPGDVVGGTCIGRAPGVFVSHTLDAISISAVEVAILAGAEKLMPSATPCTVRIPSFASTVTTGAVRDSSIEDDEGRTRRNIGIGVGGAIGGLLLLILLLPEISRRRARRRVRRQGTARGTLTLTGDGRWEKAELPASGGTSKSCTVYELDSPQERMELPVGEVAQEMPAKEDTRHEAPSSEVVQIRTLSPISPLAGS